MNGRFPFSPKFRKFQLEQGILVLCDRNIWDHGRGQLWAVRDRPKCPSPFDNTAVPSTPFLFPAHKLKRTVASVDRVCVQLGMYRSTGHVEFPKFLTGLFVDEKAPNDSVTKNLVKTRLPRSREAKKIKQQDKQAFRIDGNYWKVIFYKA